MYNTFMTTKLHVSKKRLEPEHVKVRLSRDVNSILSACLHHFEDEEREIKDHSFDVDAVVSGRSVATRNIYQRPMALVTSRPTIPIHPSAYTLSRPELGNFIPASHFNVRYA